MIFSPFIHVKKQKNPASVRGSEMKVRRIISLTALIGLLLGNTQAQSVKHEKTIFTDGSSSHMYLNVDVPSGELWINSSGHCGKSHSRMFAKDSAIVPHIETLKDKMGNLVRTLNMSQAPPRTHHAPVANLRTQTELTNINKITEESEIKTVYRHDPSLSTDLKLNLGVGKASLDLSGLTLNNLSVRSVFSDVLVTYRKPNQAEMQKMDIHATKANVVLENIDQANVNMVSIQNDMGETRISIGPKEMNGSTIYVQSGVGNCTLVISEKQAVEIVLKQGMFSKLDNQGSFTKLPNGHYVNAAYQNSPSKASACKIICSLDLGDVTLVKN
jgi:hypothetical protein